MNGPSLASHLTYAFSATSPRLCMSAPCFLESELSSNLGLWRGLRSTIFLNGHLSNIREDKVDRSLSSSVNSLLQMLRIPWEIDEVELQASG